MADVDQSDFVTADLLSGDDSDEEVISFDLAVGIRRVAFGQCYVYGVP